jgi:electron transfer flavoprotein beta subunit
MTRLRTVVCVKHVAVTAPAIGADGLAVDGESRRFEVNEADMGAVEEALAQRAVHGGSVTAVTAGPARAKEALVVALAAGADDGVHVVGEGGGRAQAAHALSGVIGELGYDLVLAGVQSSDDMLGLAGVVIAEDLGIPVVTAVGAVDVDLAGSPSAVVTRELANGYRQRLRVPLPCLLTVQLGARPLRYLPVMALVKARRRSFATRDLDALTPVAAGPGHLQDPRVLELFPPPQRSGCEILTGPPSVAASDLAGRLASKLGYPSP